MEGLPSRIDQNSVLPHHRKYVYIELIVVALFSIYKVYNHVQHPQQPPNLKVIDTSNKQIIDPKNDKFIKYMDAKVVKNLGLTVGRTPISRSKDF